MNKNIALLCIGILLGVLANMATGVQEQILAEIKSLNVLIAQLSTRPITGREVHVVEGLSEISEKLGLLMAGEFRAGNGIDPGKGFTGMRMGFPAFTYNGETWHLVGVNADGLMIGIRATDGAFLAAGGEVLIDDIGIFIQNNQSSGLTFGDSSNNRGLIGIYSTLSDSLRLQNLIPGGPSVNAGMRFALQTTNGGQPSLSWREDPANPNVLQLDLGASAKLTMGSIFEVHAGYGGYNYIHLDPATTTPPIPAAGEANIYFKGSLFIIQYDDGGATTRYKYLDLAGTGVTWVHTTVAP